MDRSARRHDSIAASLSRRATGCMTVWPSVTPCGSDACRAERASPRPAHPRVHRRGAATGAGVDAGVEVDVEFGGVARAKRQLLHPDVQRPLGPRLAREQAEAGDAPELVG